MDSRPVVFFDSGIGSLPYGNLFHLRNPNEKLICIADRVNFPYGPKSKDDVISIVSALTDSIIKQFNPKIIAVICNTASVSALVHLREKFPSVPFVGTIPAVKPAVQKSKTGKIGVLGTERTINDPYINELALSFGSDCTLIGIAAPDLVEFAEHQFAGASADERLKAVLPWVQKFRAEGADALVLGCTHFLLLLNEFRICAGSDMIICDSLEGVVQRTEHLLDENNFALRAIIPADLPADSARCPVCFAVTGDKPLEDYLLRLAEHFGMEIEILKCAH